MTQDFIRNSSKTQKQIVRVTQQPCMPIFSSHVWRFVALRMLNILAALDSVDLKKQHILSDLLPFSTYKTVLSAHYCDK